MDGKTYIQLNVPIKYGDGWFQQLCGQALKAVGCRMNREFLLHVTLGIAPHNSASLSELKSIVSTVTPPVINAHLTHAEYRK